MKTKYGLCNGACGKRFLCKNIIINKKKCNPYLERGKDYVECNNFEERES